MSEKHQGNNWASTLLGGLIAAPFVFIGFITCNTMLAAMFPLRRVLSDLLNLYAFSSKWQRVKWFIQPIQWLAGFAFLLAVLGVYISLTSTKMLTYHPALPFVLIAVALSSMAIFNAIYWLEQYANDKNIQKRNAGVAAERYVAKLIDASSLENAAALHSCLLVFNEGSSTEFSAELDHILITTRNIFVIETKSKSGTIIAEPNADKWMVKNLGGEVEMRNALKQVKNTVKVLQGQFKLPCEIIPLVAIKGNNLQILNGPTNVVDADALLKVVKAFEYGQMERIPDPKNVAALIAETRRSDEAALRRHIKRAEIASHREEMMNITNAASL